MPVPWRLFVPAGASKDKPLPLVFFLHGAGKRGDDNIGPMRLAYWFWCDKAQADQPCFVLAPQCSKKGWWARNGKGLTNGPAAKEIGPELAGALAALDEVIAKYPIDKTRIYIAGQSMGGFGTWDCLVRRPGFFAAAVPVCGGGDPSKAALLKDVPIWIWHGGKDRTVPTANSREMVEAIKKAGGSPKYNRGRRGRTPLLDQRLRQRGSAQVAFRAEATREEGEVIGRA